MIPRSIAATFGLPSSTSSVQAAKATISARIGRKLDQRLVDLPVDLRRAVVGLAKEYRRPERKRCKTRLSVANGECDFCGAYEGEVCNATKERDG